jgi:ParB family chromosome partitioning protein
MIKNKAITDIKGQRVFFPELETVFKSEEPRTFIPALDDEGCSKNKEEDLGTKESQEKEETGEIQKKIENIKPMKTEDLKESEPFCRLFPIDLGILFQIRENMETHGYDFSQPVTVWNGKRIVVDGHTRVKAALGLGIKQIPVFEKDFADEEEALDYAIHCQVNRRNLPDSEIFRLVQVMDERRKVGRPSKEITSNEVNKNSIRLMLEKVRAPETRRTSKITASLLKTSATKVEKVRTILDKGDETIKGAVLAGEITINKAYAETLKKPKTCIQRFSRDGLRATLTLSKDLGEVKWIILGFGEPPNQESVNSITLHSRN